MDTQRDATHSGALSITTLLGSIEVSPRDIVTFPAGLPGFEQSKRFVILPSADIAPLSLLQAVDGAPVSFFVIDPGRAMAGYRGVMSEADKTRLGAQDESVLVWLAIVSFDDAERAFVNLRAPIVINPKRRLGCQVMPHRSVYALRHPLSPE